MGPSLRCFSAIPAFLKPSTREPVFARAWKKSLKEIDPALEKRVEIMDWDEQRIQSIQSAVAYGSDDTLQRIRAKLPPHCIPFAGYGHKIKLLELFFQEAFKSFSSEELLERARQDADPFRLQGCPVSSRFSIWRTLTSERWPELQACVDVCPRLKVFSAWRDVFAGVG